MSQIEERRKYMQGIVTGAGRAIADRAIAGTDYSRELDTLIGAATEEGRCDAALATADPMSIEDQDLDFQQRDYKHPEQLIGTCLEGVATVWD
jgi:hypothetical protein